MVIATDLLSVKLKKASRPIEEKPAAQVVAQAQIAASSAAAEQKSPPRAAEVLAEPSKTLSVRERANLFKGSQAAAAPAKEPIDIGVSDFATRKATLGASLKGSSPAASAPPALAAPSSLPEEIDDRPASLPEEIDDRPVIMRRRKQASKSAVTSLLAEEAASAQGGAAAAANVNTPHRQFTKPPSDSADWVIKPGSVRRPPHLPAPKDVPHPRTAIKKSQMARSKNAEKIAALHIVETPKKRPIAISKEMVTHAVVLVIGVAVGYAFRYLQEFAGRDRA